MLDAMPSKVPCVIFKNFGFGFSMGRLFGEFAGACCRWKRCTRKSGYPEPTAIPKLSTTTSSRDPMSGGLALHDTTPVAPAHAASSTTSFCPFPLADVMVSMQGDKRPPPPSKNGFGRHQMSPASRSLSASSSSPHIFTITVMIIIFIIIMSLLFAVVVPKSSTPSPASRRLVPQVLPHLGRADWPQKQENRSRIWATQKVARK